LIAWNLSSVIIIKCIQQYAELKVRLFAFIGNFENQFPRCPNFAGYGEIPDRRIG
jgi:hypothetical protein